jgi:hypothetical protein
MDGYQFIASIVGSYAWPALVGRLKNRVAGRNVAATAHIAISRIEVSDGRELRQALVRDGP